MDKLYNIYKIIANQKYYGGLNDEAKPKNFNNPRFFKLAGYRRILQH